MSKQETTQYLTDLMATIAMAYYKHGLFLPPEPGAGFGRRGQLYVHETGEAGVSIDLYDLFDDGLPQCPNLVFDSTCPADGKPIRQKAFCISYSPDQEEHPVLLQCNDATQDVFDGSFDLTLDNVPIKTIRSITAWIENLLPKDENDYGKTGTQD